jgi:hypothetical protein
MTREQLDAIRARYADEPLLGEMRTDKFGNLITVTREHPVVALLAEVERLRKAAVWEEDQVHRMVTNAHLRGAQETRERMQAEVERLTAEVESKAKQNVALVGMNGRLQLEVERLTADPLPAAAWVREVERAAFSRGVAAMREAAASHFSVVAPYDYIAPRIRALPDPEDK